MSTVEFPRLLIDSAALVATVAPIVVANRDPGPDDVGVPIDSAIAMEIMDTEGGAVDLASVRVWVGDALAFDGNAIPPVLPAFAGPLAGVTESADALRVVLRPVIVLPSLAKVVVRVVAAEVGGGAAIDESYSFVVEDRTAPQVIAAQATDPATVRIGFDEAVAIPAGAEFAFAARAGPAVPIAPRSVRVEGTVAVVTLDTEMTPDIDYAVRVAGVTDLSGNPVLPPYDSATFTGFRLPRPAKRRFDLWQMLPKHNRRDDRTGDLRRFISCLQEVTDLLLGDLDRWPDIFDYERAPEAFLNAMLVDLGNPFPFELDVLGRRRLASVLVQMYQQKGTAKGIRNVIRFFLGIDVSAILPLAADTLILGESELGVDWVLGPSDRFARYAFSVEVSRALTALERKYLRAIVQYMKPAHTHFVDLIEPRPPVVPDHWELGLSDIGETTRLH